MYLTTDMRLFWPSTNGTIPAGFTRDTDYDTFFLSCPTGEAGSSSGGSHTHSMPHEHPIPPLSFGHAHTVTGNLVFGGTSGSTVGLTAARLQGTHAHVGINSAYVDEDVASATDESASTNAEPPYFKIIVIKPNDGNQQIPEGCLVLADRDIGDDSFKIVDGVSSTITITDKFLLGADASGDAGGTGGATTHTHIDNSHSHDTTHFHPSTLCGGGTGTINSTSTGTTPTHTNAAHHNVTLGTAEFKTAPTNAGTTNAGTNIPKYIKLAGFENISGIQDVKPGIIIGYAGTRASLTTEGWDFLNQANTKFIWVLSSMTDVLDDGGNALTHTHRVTSFHNHTFTGGTHSHTANGVQTPVTYTSSARGGPYVANNYHTHSWAVGSTGSGPTGYTLTDIMFEESDSTPKNKGLLLIRYGEPNVHIKGANIQGGAIANA